MKKIASLILAVVMIVSVIYIAPLTANAATSDFKYKTVSGNYVEITGYKGNETEITIPYKIGKKLVMGIAKKAFYGNESITSVTVMPGISYLSNNVFQDCINLSNILLPDTIVLVGKNSFAGTAYYENKNNWDNNALYIDSCLIEYNGTEVEYTVKEGTTVIGDNAFKGNKKIKICNLPDTLLTVGNYAFHNTGLNTDLVFPENLMIIGDYAYHGVFAKKVVMPDTVEILGECAFKNSYVTEVDLSDSITEIPKECFDYCSKLQTVKLPKNLVYIGDRAFRFGKIEEIKIPKGVEYIGSWAFNGNNLSKIDFPDKYIVFNYDAFDQNAFDHDKDNWYKGGLYMDNYLMTTDAPVYTLEIKEGTKYIAGEAISGPGALSKLIIPDSVKAIGAKAFEGCDNLKSVEIPASVEYIGDAAFGIYDYFDTYYKYSYFKIIGIPDSTAHKYAKAYGLKFVDGSKTKTIKLNKTTLSMGVGETFTLKKTVTPMVSGSGSKWKSSNKSVVKVNQKGKLTALKAGTAVITVKTPSGKKAQCKVTVYKNPEKISFESKKQKLGCGEEFILPTRVNEGSYISDEHLTFTSSNPKVVKVKKLNGGRVKLISKGFGKAVIKVKTSNGKTAKCKITVVSFAHDLNIDKTKLTLESGKSTILTVKMEEDHYLSDQNYSWKSSNTNVVKVTRLKNGRAQVTAVGKGTATISLESHFMLRTNQCKVTVK